MHAYHAARADLHRALAACDKVRPNMLRTLAVATYGMKVIRKCARLVGELGSDVDGPKALAELMTASDFFDKAVESARLARVIKDCETAIEAYEAFGDRTPIEA